MVVWYEVVVVSAVYDTRVIKFNPRWQPFFEFLFYKICKTTCDDVNYVAKTDEGEARSIILLFFLQPSSADESW